MSELVKSTHTGFQMPVLIYPTGALTPVISQATVELHYGKHLQTYVDNLNKFVAETEFEGMTLREIISQAPPALCSTMPGKYSTTRSTSSSSRPIHPARTSPGTT